MLSRVHSASGVDRNSSALSVYHLLIEAVGHAPTGIAIAAPGRTPLTYAHLRDQIDATIHALNQMGVGRNDRVGLVMPQGPEMAVALTAAMAGSTCVPLNPASSAAECDFYLSHVKPRLLVVQVGMDVPARSVAKTYNVPIIELVPDLGAAAGSFTLSGDARETPVPWTCAQPDDVALMLHTSGTTSKPKLVPLTNGNLCASARNLQAALHLDDDDRCLNVMPLFHIHGIMVMLASLLAGAGVASVPKFDTTAFFSWLDDLCPTWYSAVPTIHHAILAQADSHRATIARRPFRFIRSCSAPLPLRVATDLERVFDAPVIEAYGMTEASHQITCNPLPPKERKPGSVGLASGVEVEIVDATGNGLPVGDIGEIAIRGASVIRKYANELDASASALRGGWFRTGDLGRLDPDGYLFLVGRIKEIINRGGEKVSPREIDDILLAHPAVAQAAAFPVPHPTLGEDIAAAVVLLEPAIVTGKELRSFAATRLSDFKVPNRILVVDAIPKGPTGKLERSKLAEQFRSIDADHATLGMHTEVADEAPRTPLERFLAYTWATLLGVDNVGIHDNFFELGGNSLLAVQVVSRIRTTFWVDLPLRTLFEAPTVAEVATAIADRFAQSPEREEQTRILSELEDLSETEAVRLLRLAMPGMNGVFYE
jgi:acyl-CoA synthetase (AMP-forming)/AMP-acid ligase II